MSFLMSYFSKFGIASALSSSSLVDSLAASFFFFSTPLQTVIDHSTLWLIVGQADLKCYRQSDEELRGQTERPQTNSSGFTILFKFVYLQQWHITDRGRDVNMKKHLKTQKWKRINLKCKKKKQNKTKSKVILFFCWRSQHNILVFMIFPTRHSLGKFF